MMPYSAAVFCSFLWSGNSRTKATLCTGHGHSKYYTEFVPLTTTRTDVISMNTL